MHIYGEWNNWGTIIIIIITIITKALVNYKNSRFQLCIFTSSIKAWLTNFQILISTNG